MSRELSIAYTTGATVTAKIIAHTTGTVTATISLTETPTSVYYGSIGAIAAGNYDVVYFDGSAPIGSYAIQWDGSAIVSSTVDLSGITTSLAAIKTKTDTIGAVSVIITSPVSTDGTITIVAGDDYKASDGRAITFTFTGVPVLTGGAVTLYATYVFNGTTISVGGTVTSSSSVQFEIPHTVTSTMGVGDSVYAYDIRITLNDGSVITLQSGVINVME